MNATEQASDERVIALLADRLCAAGVLPWPGTDGLTLEDVVRAAHHSAATAGVLPSPTELIELHPDLADDIRRYFSADEGECRHDRERTRLMQVTPDSALCNSDTSTNTTR